MVNITHKSNILRKAVAQAILKVSSTETIRAIESNAVPKGNVFEFSRAAGLLAIKKTSDIIPDCHPLPIEFASVQYNINQLEINISVEVHTIYKTGVEVEAMHGASVVALTMYDMLKPVDKGIEISSIKLLHKSGGKSDYSKKEKQLSCSVIICSDSVFEKKSEDVTGKTVITLLEKYDLDINLQIVPDDFNLIQKTAIELSNKGCDILLFAGGTGLSPKDLTPDAIAPLLDREIPGIMEHARQYGQQRTPYAMLSRGVAGFIKNSLVITMPGSPSGAKDTLNALFPYVLHLFEVAKGMRHE